MRDFLSKNGLDYVIINSTNEFLVEYNSLQANSRYHLTGFSGSTGDALARKDSIYLFVDGRYHEQADRECDLSKITVVKLGPTQKIIEEIFKKIKPNSTLGVVAEKTSVLRYKMLEKILSTKNIQIKVLKEDPYKKNVKEKQKQISSIPQVICGLSVEEKISSIRKTLGDGEACLFTNLEEVSYLTNLRDFNKDYSTSINAKFLVEKSSSSLFCDDKIEKAIKNLEILPLQDFQNQIIGLSKIFYDGASTNLKDFLLFESIAEKMIENPASLMKSIKTQGEINHYKECFKRTDMTVMAIRKYIEHNENLSEKDITEKLEEEFIKNGAKSLSFKSIVAKDKNSALAHYSKNSKTEILKDGSLVLIDCGGYYEGGYATDITRVFVKGTPTQEQKQIYTLVLKAFLNAFNTPLNNLTTGFDIDKVARDLLINLAPKGFEFSHGLGHGIGISVHESPPRLSSHESSKIILKENMCFTIEPGLYFKDFGGVRLENSVYIKDEKIKSFSKMCYEKKLIDFTFLSEEEKIWLKDFEVL